MRLVPGSERILADEQTDPVDGRVRWAAATSLWIGAMTLAAVGPGRDQTRAGLPRLGAAGNGLPRLYGGPRHAVARRVVADASPAGPGARAGVPAGGADRRRPVLRRGGAHLDVAAAAMGGAV